MNRKHQLIVLLVVLFTLVWTFVSPRPEIGDQSEEASFDSASSQTSNYSPIVEPAAAVASSGKPTGQTGEMIIAHLARLKACWSTDTCGFSDSDPRANHFEAMQIIKERLNDLRTLKRNDLNADFTNVAREWLMFPDDHIRAAALLLLREHEQSEANFRAIVESLRASMSAPYYEIAMKDLRLYQGAGFNREVREFLADILRTGPLKAGETVAAEILSLLNEDNEKVFTSVAESLPAGSRKRRDLEAALEEFRKLRIGG